MSRTYVHLFKDGDRFAVETNAEEEHAFLLEVASELDSIVEAGHFSGDISFQLSGWLPHVVDICCRLRGYKANVQERRVILSGVIDPDSSKMVKGLPEGGIHGGVPHGSATLGNGAVSSS